MPSFFSLSFSRASAETLSREISVRHLRAVTNPAARRDALPLLYYLREPQKRSITLAARESWISIKTTRERCCFLVLNHESLLGGSRCASCLSVVFFSVLCFLYTSIDNGNNMPREWLRAARAFLTKINSSRKSGNFIVGKWQNSWIFFEIQRKLHLWSELSFSEDNFEIRCGSINLTYFLTTFEIDFYNS